MRLCAVIECGVCHRVTVIILDNGIHYCSNNACHATLIIANDINAMIKNNSIIQYTYEC